MFKKLKKRNILSPADGDVVPLKNVPDPVFSEKMLGDGFAVIPSDNHVYAPVGGKVIDAADTLHAYCITSDDGTDILVHVGIDTVKLGGKGFSAAVKSGDTVNAGELLCTFDFDELKKNGCHTHIPVIVTNSEELKSLDIDTGSKRKGDVAAVYNK